jgi:phosphopantothenoylcysteine decarboxylase
VIACINERSRTLRVVPPQEKRLACGDVGLGAMAEVTQIVDVVNQLTRG